MICSSCLLQLQLLLYLLDTRQSYNASASRVSEFNTMANPTMTRTKAAAHCWASQARQQSAAPL